MAELSANDTRALARSFRELAASLSDYRIANAGKLKTAEREAIESAEWTLLNESSELWIRATRMTLDDAGASLEDIRGVTARLKDALKTLQEINKAVKIAAAGARLAAAIAKGNSLEIAKAVNAAVAIVR
jgi:hypothetical protein